MDEIILGLIQGFTEFLPVSSSGHLALAKIFLGIDMPPLGYDLVLHAATMLATVIFFFRDIRTFLFQWAAGFISSDARAERGWTVGWAVIIGTVITGAIGIVLKKYAEDASLNSMAVAFGLLFTGVMLIISKLFEEKQGTVRGLDGVFVGIAQGIAVMPGVSRSGMTIFAGMAAGLLKEEAFNFSFLLSIPAICGAVLLEALDLGGIDGFLSTLPPMWLPGAAAAFVSGFASLFILRRLVLSSKWHYFGLYCIIVGIASLCVTFLGIW